MGSHKHHVLDYPNVTEVLGSALNLQKSSLQPFHRLEYLGLISPLRFEIFNPESLRLHFCTRVLGLMVASFKTVPFVQFHSRPLQCKILWYCGTKSLLSLDGLILAVVKDKAISGLMAQESSSGVREVLSSCILEESQQAPGCWNKEESWELCYYWTPTFK